jgi:hypothetical protein
MFLFKSGWKQFSGYDLVQQMQLGGDLQTTWIMFDRVKCVHDWMTFACHVCDLFYYKVMMIALFVTCNLKT